MPNTAAPTAEDFQIAPEIIRVAVSRICASKTFATAGQQRAALQFLVDEDLAGRATHGSQDAAIAALYSDREAEAARAKLTWVLSRLAEKLAEYYEADGADDPLRIDVDVAGCGLRFRMWEAEVAQARPAPHHVSPRLLAPLAVLCAALAVGVFLLWDTSKDAPLNDQAAEALVDGQTAQGAEMLPEGMDGLSVAELELAGRDYLFPLLDIERQEVALAVSREVIRRDPEYAPGYATAGYSLATLALMRSGGALSRRYLEQANQMTARAMELDPNDPWVLAAVGFSAYAASDFAVGQLFANKAHSKAPYNGYVAGSYSIVMLATGQYQSTFDASKDLRFSDVRHFKLAFSRLYAYATFHLGDYAATIEVLEAAEADGLEHNVATLMYLAAAYQAIGNHAKARENVQLLKQQWPTFRPEMIYGLFFSDPSEGDELMQLLSAAGWSFVD